MTRRNSLGRVVRLASEALEPRIMLDGSGVTDATLLAAADLPDTPVTGPEAAAAALGGEARRWHKLTFDFEGPATSETAAVNPFTDYRLDVTFRHTATGDTYVVPGFYAADGDAANTSATGGSVWRAHFAPHAIGAWTYTASFRTGANVAVADSPLAGASAGFFDGMTGSFDVLETDKTGRDLRARGRLEYVGEHYPRFAGSGEYFLKQGADAPENLLAYADFDGPFKNDGQGDGRIKTYTAHVGDWNEGDPTWADGKGKGLIGAVNYLASEGMNAFSFLPMNINGDDRNVFPYLDYNERLRMDVSRLAQWEVVFEHADHQGMFLHFKTQETENDDLLDGGALGVQRKLYYRELIARFSHHLALNWNLGEENTNTTQQRKDFAQYFRDHDPYDHLIVIHTYPGQQDQVYNPLLGSASELTGASIQTSQADFRNVHRDTLKWVQASAAAGKPWAVAVDEPGDAQHAIRPDNDAGASHVDGRKNALWGTLMAGGWGNEYYFGYGHAHSDLTLQDFRSRDDWWDYARHALSFFNDNEVPFWEMSNDNEISTAANDYGFYKAGDTYAVYLKNGGTTGIDLSLVGGTYDVRWFDPRNGGALQFGSVGQVTGGGVRNLGQPPSSPGQDWAILVTLAEDDGVNDPPVVAIVQADPTPTGESGVFQEENGLVVIELESQPPVDGWQQQTAVPGYTGDGYFRWEGPNLFGNPGAQGVIQYKINITNPGTYQMRFHSHRDGDVASDQENDVWARMDDEAWIKVYSGTQGQWTWASNFDFGPGNRPSPSYQLDAGEHTFTISGRSNGFRLDRVAFYNPSLTGANVALNLARPESPTSGGTGEGSLTFDLVAAVSDDGLALPTPTLFWSLDGGPGTAVFSDPDSATTSVTFSEPGAYRVRFRAGDGEFIVGDRRVIMAPAVTLPEEEESVGPTDDATVEGSNGQNNDVIKVQASGPSRTGYLRFEADGVDSSVVGAYVRLTVSQDPGSGTINLYEADSSAWSEGTINAANAPAAGALLDSVGGTHSAGNVLEFDVTDAITADGAYSFVVQHGGGNDVWFSSKEGSAPPQLVLIRDNAGLPGDFDRNGAVDEADGAFWRLAYGSTVGDGLLADANGDGLVDAADYTVWRDNLGAIAAPVVARAATPPTAEPEAIDAAIEEAPVAAAFLAPTRSSTTATREPLAASTAAWHASGRDDLLLIALGGRQRDDADDLVELAESEDESVADEALAADGLGEAL